MCFSVRSTSAVDCYERMMKFFQYSTRYYDFFQIMKKVSLDHSHTNDNNQIKELKEFLNSKSQMSDFTNTRKKAIKQRKKTKRLSSIFFLVLASTLQCIHAASIHHIFRLHRNLMSGLSVASWIFCTNLHLAHGCEENIDIASREIVAPRNVTIAVTRVMSDQNFLKQFSIAPGVNKDLHLGQRISKASKEESSTRSVTITGQLGRKPPMPFRIHFAVKLMTLNHIKLIDKMKEVTYF